ncbi:hypothetical protein B0J14DRAFT_645053 [Halenospora varia]|nr:hypothetical protein B0J14DRAFT_645053 [Halenospora varia]
MDFKKTQKYALLGEESQRGSSSTDDITLKDESEGEIVPRLSPKARFWNRVRSGLWHGGLLLAVSLTAFYAGWKLSPKHQEIDTAWNELKKEIKYVPYTFDPHFVTPPSEYMGKPNPDLDERWYHLAELRNFAADKETLVRANKSEAPVRWPGTDTYQIGLETFHQLHCLNYIRMYTYMDYYGEIDFDMQQEPLEERTEHKDHCVDVLRQHLMCAPDLNIYTFHWTKHSPVPFFDLKTNHKCIDWNHFDSWTTAQKVFRDIPPKPTNDADLLP